MLVFQMEMTKGHSAATSALSFALSPEPQLLEMLADKLNKLPSGSSLGLEGTIALDITEGESDKAYPLRLTHYRGLFDVTRGRHPVYYVTSRDNSFEQQLEVNDGWFVGKDPTDRPNTVSAYDDQFPLKNIDVSLKPVIGIVRIYPHRIIE